MKRLILFLILVLSLLCIACGNDSDKSVANKSEQPQQQLDAGKSPVAEMNDEQYQNLFKAFAACEFSGNFNVARHKDTDNLTKANEISFLVFDDDQNTFLVFFAPNNTVYRIIHANYELYLNGTVKYKASDFVLTKDEKKEIISIVKEAVINHLNKSGLNTENIEFWGIDDWRISKTPDGITAASYLVLPNNKGQRKRMDFNANLDKSNKQVLNIKFSGKLADKAPEKNESILHSILN